MSRKTQFIGLSKEAKSYFIMYCRNDFFQVYKNGEFIYEYTEPIKQPGEIIHDTFREEIQLYNYELADGTILREKVQVTYWSSGLVIFTFLVKDKECDQKIIGRWTDKEINEYL